MNACSAKENGTRPHWRRRRNCFYGCVALGSHIRQDGLYRSLRRIRINLQEPLNCGHDISAPLPSPSRTTRLPVWSPKIGISSVAMLCSFFCALQSLIWTSASSSFSAAWYQTNCSRIGYHSSLLLLLLRVSSQATVYLLPSHFLSHLLSLDNGGWFLRSHFRSGRARFAPLKLCWRRNAWN